MFLLDLEPNLKPILNPIRHETYGKNNMKTRLLGQKCYKQYSLHLQLLQTVVTNKKIVLNIATVGGSRRHYATVKQMKTLFEIVAKLLPRSQLLYCTLKIPVEL